MQSNSPSTRKAAPFHQERPRSNIKQRPNNNISFQDCATELNHNIARKKSKKMEKTQQQFQQEEDRYQLRFQNSGRIVHPTFVPGDYKPTADAIINVNQKQIIQEQKKSLQHQIMQKNKSSQKAQKISTFNQIDYQTKTNQQVTPRLGQDPKQHQNIRRKVVELQQKMKAIEQKQNDSMNSIESRVTRNLGLMSKTIQLNTKHLQKNQTLIPSVHEKKVEEELREEVKRLKNHVRQLKISNIKNNQHQFQTFGHKSPVHRYKPLEGYDGFHESNADRRELDKKSSEKSRQKSFIQSLTSSRRSNFGRILKNKNKAAESNQFANNQFAQQKVQDKNQFHTPKNSNEFQIQQRDQQGNQMPRKLNTQTLNARRIPTRSSSRRSLKSNQKEAPVETKKKQFKIKRANGNRMLSNQQKFKQFLSQEKKNTHFTRHFKNQTKFGKMGEINRQNVDPIKDEIIKQQMPKSRNIFTSKKKNIVSSNKQPIIPKQKQRKDSVSSSNRAPSDLLHIPTYRKSRAEQTVNPQNLIQSTERHKLSKIETKQLILPPVGYDLAPYYIPEVPLPPTQATTQKELVELLIKLSNVLQFKFDPTKSQLIVKKYRNCIVIPQPTNTIVWHFNGKVYVGQYRQDNSEHIKSGEGVQYLPDKYLYKGQFKNNKRSGSGILVSNGVIFKGQFLQNMKSGRGISYKILPDGSIPYYDGEWINNKKQGYGIQKFSQNNFYIGTFKDNLKSGFGQEKFQNGDTYKGQYLDDLFHGEGEYSWANGAKYCGKFVQNFRQGYGRWKSNNSGSGDSYEGQYKKDKKEGFGTYKWATGCIYRGNFINDKKHGQGRVTYPDDMEMKGLWENGTLVEVLQKVTQTNQEDPLVKKFSKVRKTIVVAESVYRPVQQAVGIQTL